MERKEAYSKTGTWGEGVFQKINNYECKGTSVQQGKSLWGGEGREKRRGGVVIRMVKMQGMEVIETVASD